MFQYLRTVKDINRNQSKKNLANYFFKKRQYIQPYAMVELCTVSIQAELLERFRKTIRSKNIFSTLREIPYTHDPKVFLY